MTKFLKKIFIISVLLTFAKTSYAETKDYFEPVNRFVFSVNMGLDKIVFKPIAKGYSYLPSPLQTGVKNATNNVTYFVQIPNKILHVDEVYRKKIDIKNI